jgi:hypothetical protein
VVQADSCESVNSTFAQADGTNLVLKTEGKFYGMQVAVNQHAPFNVVKPRDLVGSQHELVVTGTKSYITAVRGVPTGSLELDSSRGVPIISASQLETMQRVRDKPVEVVAVVNSLTLPVTGVDHVPVNDEVKLNAAEVRPEIPVVIQPRLVQLGQLMVFKPDGGGNERVSLVKTLQEARVVSRLDIASVLEVAELKKAPFWKSVADHYGVRIIVMTDKLDVTVYSGKGYQPCGGELMLVVRAGCEYLVIRSEHFQIVPAGFSYCSNLDEWTADSRAEEAGIVVPALHVADVAKVLDAKKKAVVDRIQREKQAAGLQSITDVHTFAQWKKQNLKAQVERAYVKFRSKKYKRKIEKLTANTVTHWDAETSKSIHYSLGHASDGLLTRVVGKPVVYQDKCVVCSLTKFKSVTHQVRAKPTEFLPGENIEIDSIVGFNAQGVPFVRALLLVDSSTNHVGLSLVTGHTMAKTALALEMALTELAWQLRPSGSSVPVKIGSVTRDNGTEFGSAADILLNELQIFTKKTIPWSNHAYRAESKIGLVTVMARRLMVGQHVDLYPFALIHAVLLHNLLYALTSSTVLGRKTVTDMIPLFALVAGPMPKVKQSKTKRDRLKARSTMGMFLGFCRRTGGSVVLRSNGTTEIFKMVNVLPTVDGQEDFASDAEARLAIDWSDPVVRSMTVYGHEDDVLREIWSANGVEPVDVREPVDSERKSLGGKSDGNQGIGGPLRDIAAEEEKVVVQQLDVDPDVGDAGVEQKIHQVEEVVELLEDEVEVKVVEPVVAQDQVDEDQEDEVVAELDVREEQQAQLVEDEVKLPHRYPKRKNRGKPPGRWFEVGAAAVRMTFKKLVRSAIHEPRHSEATYRVAAAQFRGKTEMIHGRRYQQGVPRSISEALQHPKWKEAIFAEKKSFDKHQVFERVRRPDYPIKEIPMREELVIKPGGRFKARFVMQGQYMKLPRAETHSKQVHKTTIRLMTAEAHARGWDVSFHDVPTAFLWAGMTGEVYVKPISELWPVEDGYVYRLRKACYGMPNAPRLFYDELDSTLLSLGCKRMSQDGGLYIHPSSAIIMVFVDDIFVAGAPGIRETLLTALRKKYELRDEAGTAFVGVETELVDEHSLWQSSQHKNVRIWHMADYTEAIAEKWGEHNKPKTRLPTVIAREQRESKMSENMGEHATMYGNLLHIAVSTRPDVAATLSMLRKPTEYNHTKLRQLMRYMCTTRFTGIPVREQGDAPMMCAYVDASHTQQEIRYGTSGLVMFWRGSLVLYKTWKQTMAAVSTVAAEGLAMEQGAKTVAFYRQLMIDVFKAANWPMEEVQKPVVIYEDNLPLIDVLKGYTVVNSGTRHIHKKMEVIRDLIADKKIIVEHVQGDNQLADVLTKRKPTKDFEAIGMMQKRSA